MRHRLIALLDDAVAEPAMMPRPRAPDDARQPRPAVAAGARVALARADVTMLWIGLAIHREFCSALAPAIKIEWPDGCW